MERLPSGRATIEYDDGEVEEIDLNDEVLLAQGELLWAKMKGFPWWPSRQWNHVGKIQSKQCDEPVIEFLGEDHTAPVSAVETVPFKRNFNKHIAALLRPEGDARKRGAHKHASAAVQEAMDALGLPLFVGEGEDPGALLENGSQREVAHKDKAGRGKGKLGLMDAHRSHDPSSTFTAGMSQDTTARLVESYLLCARPTEEQISLLEDSCGLNRKHIVRWFLNRRKRETNGSFDNPDRLNTVYKYFMLRPYP